MKVSNVSISLNIPEYRNTYTTPWSVVGGASASGFWLVRLLFVGPRMLAPSEPRMGTLGAPWPLTGDHIIVLAASDAGETVAVSGTMEVTVAGVLALSLMTVADGILPPLGELEERELEEEERLVAAEDVKFCRANSCPGAANTVATKRH